MDPSAAPPDLRPRESRPAPQMPGACSRGGCGGGAAPRPPAPSFARVTVDGAEIAPEATAREMQHHPAPDPASAWRAAARALVVRDLLLAEARRLDLAPEPGRDGAGAETEADALIRALLSREAAAEPPDEAAMRRLYDAQAGRFRTPDLFEASHVLIEPETDDAAGWAAAEAEARRLAASLAPEGRAAFAEAARALSRCPSAAQDGSLGQIRRGDLVEPVQAAIEALPDGTTAPAPVRSRFGWHVLRLERRIPGRALPYEMVRGRIADRLEARAWATAAARLLARLVARARVEGVDVGAPGFGEAAP